MPSGDFFESQSKRSIDFKLIAIGAIALIVLKLTEPDRLNSVE